MFDLQQFVKQCRAALDDPKPAQTIEALVREAIANPGAVRDAFASASGVEQQGPITFACRDEHLSVADVTTPPGLRSPAHNHKMWAVIGVYDGQEHNRFFRMQDHRTLCAPSVTIADCAACVGRDLPGVPAEHVRAMLGDRDANFASELAAADHVLMLGQVIACQRLAIASDMQPRHGL